MQSRKRPFKDATISATAIYVMYENTPRSYVYSNGEEDPFDRARREREREVVSGGDVEAGGETA